VTLRLQQQRRRRRNPGFTLLEVMVALAILAIAMSAVFSAEAGSVRMAARARKTGWAAMLVRCKMGEIEEQIMSEGFPAVFDEGTDNCCEDAKIEGFTCKWVIEPVTMPDTMFEGEDKDGDGMPDAPEGSEGEGEGAKADAKGSGPDGKGLLDDSEDKPKDKKKLDTAAILKDPKKLLGGSSSGDDAEGEGGGAPDVDAIASMAMSYVYPILKPSFESQIRRATVEVMWKEGGTEKAFDVTQYLVAEQPIVMPDGTTDPNAQDPGSSGGGKATGKNSTSSGSSMFGTSNTGTSQ
jgi:general secretion pathway protein I